MRLLGLFEDADGPCARLRFDVYRPFLSAAGVEIATHTIPRGRRDRRSLLRSARDFDVVFWQRRLMNIQDQAYLGRHARRLVFDFDDALPFRERPPFRSATRRRRFAFALRRADVILAGNAYLGWLAEQHGARASVLPTTAGTVEPRTSGEREDRTLLWVGQAATSVHLPALFPVVADLKRGWPDLRMIALGAAPGVPGWPTWWEYPTWSEAKEAELLSRATVGLAPLPDDPFTRGKCAARVLRYLAHGLPAVASPVGVQRELAERGGGVLLATEPASWNQAIQMLLGSPDERRRLGVDGVRLVRDSYSAAALWERFAHAVLGRVLP